MADPRILVVRLGSLGDIVHAFPAVGGLRSSFPNSEIIWVTHPKWEFLVKTSGLATDVWTVDTRNWSNVRSTLSRIRRHRFETAIDYQGLWKSAAIPFLAWVPRRIGFSSETVRERGVPILYTDRVRALSNAHIADQNGKLSIRAGARTPIGDVNLRVPGEDEQVVRARIAKEGIENYVVLSPGGGWRSKCWPVERYGSLAAKILEEFGLQTVINVGPGEADLSTAVIRAAGNAQPLPWTGSLKPGPTDGAAEKRNRTSCRRYGTVASCGCAWRTGCGDFWSYRSSAQRALQAIGNCAALGRCSDNI